MRSARLEPIVPSEVQFERRPLHFIIVLDWFEELKRLVPTGGR
jgi:hypothetical protein